MIIEPGAQCPAEFLLEVFGRREQVAGAIVLKPITEILQGLPVPPDLTVTRHEFIFGQVLVDRLSGAVLLPVFGRPVFDVRIEQKADDPVSVLCGALALEAGNALVLRIVGIVRRPAMPVGDDRDDQVTSIDPLQAVVQWPLCRGLPVFAELGKKAGIARGAFRSTAIVGQILDRRRDEHTWRLVGVVCRHALSLRLLKTSLVWPA